MNTSKKKEITLICRPMIFYAQEDETCFFSWLKKMSFITHCEGVGIGLTLTISKDLSIKDTWELLGFFRRYELEPKYLLVLVNKKNEKLINDFLDKKLFTRELNELEQLGP